MGDEDGGTSRRQALEPLEDGVLRLGVERRRGLVEDENVRFFAHERARQGDLLPLPARQLDPAREPSPELGVEAGAQRGHQLARAALLDRASEAQLVLEMLHAAEGHVLAHRQLVLVEVLEDDANPTPQLGLVPGPEISPVEQHAPLGRLIEVRQQLDERGFARAVLPTSARLCPLGTKRLTSRSAHLPPGASAVSTA